MERTISSTTQRNSRLYVISGAGEVDVIQADGGTREFQPSA
jgi:hypothetical protein